MTLNEAQQRQLADDLRELPELAALVATAVTPERLSTGGARGVPSSRPPLNVDALALTGRFTDLDNPTEWTRGGGGIVWLDHRKRPHGDDGMPSILSCLAAWTRMAHADLTDAHRLATQWRYGRPTPLAERVTVTSETSWLTRHAPWIADQPWASDLVADVHRMVVDCRRVLRERPAYTPRCTRDFGGERCDGLLHDQGAGFWTCDRCGETRSDRRLGLRETVVRQQPMTAGQIWTAFGIRRDTLANWVARELLTPAEAKRPGDEARYHVSEVLGLVNDAGLTHAAASGEAMTIAGLAAHLNLPAGTLHDWQAKGIIKPITGRHVRRGRLYLVTDVVAAARHMGRAEEGR